jgi:Tfp pilus assembly protein PilN
MRAINLIPAEERRGAGGTAGRSGGGAHVVLAALALLVALVAVYTVSGREIKTKQAELSATESQLAVLKAEAARLQGYEQFAALRERRVQTVASIAGSRFDWSHALRELSRVTTDEAWLTAVTGTVSPGVNLGGGAGGLRSALPLPALELSGCTVSQDAVARMMSRLRQVDGVERVSLSSSEKAEAAAGGGGPGGDCRMGSAKYPQFQMVVFLSAPTPATTPGAASASATPAAAKTSTPAAGPSTQP